MITISNQTTGRARVNTVAQCLRNARAAKTGLTCTSWVNFHEHASGALSLVREIKEKVRPSSIVDRLAQKAASKTADIQIFNSYQTAVIDDPARLYVMKVPALIADVIREPAKQQRGLTSPVRSFYASCKSSLKSTKFLFRSSEPTRIFNLTSVAQRSKRNQTNVNADHAWIKRQGFRFYVYTEQSKPTIGLTFYSKSLYRAVNGPMKRNAHSPNTGQAQPSTLQDGPKSISVSKAVVSTQRTEARIPGFFTAFNPAKETLKRKLNTLEHVFQYLSVDSRNVLAQWFNLSQLKCLINVRNRLALYPPSVTSFLQGRVVQLTANSKLIIQNDGLSLSGVNTIAVGLEH